MSTDTLPDRPGLAESLAAAHAMTDAQILAALKKHHNGKHLTKVPFGFIVVTISDATPLAYWFPICWVNDERDASECISRFGDKSACRIINLES